jgi:hypothetical protein
MAFAALTRTVRRRGFDINGIGNRNGASSPR